MAPGGKRRPEASRTASDVGGAEPDLLLDHCPAFGSAAGELNPVGRPGRGLGHDPHELVERGYRAQPQFLRTRRTFGAATVLELEERRSDDEDGRGDDCNTSSGVYHFPGTHNYGP
jgi:hypothetical protein